MRWTVAVLTFLLTPFTRAQGHPAATGSLSAQSREFTGGHLDKLPILDGKIEESEYRDAIHFDGLVDENTGGAAPEGGEFFLGCDDRFVYFAARLVDRQPGSIQATEFRTNVSLNGNDTVGLSLDPFGRFSDFSFFEMNARGATNLQIAGGRAAKREWLGDFAAKGRVTDKGWEVEARIPWSVLRLPGRGPHDLRFNVFRNFRRYQRTYSWAFTSNGLVQNNGRWKAVDLPDAPRPALQLLPYAYGSFEDKRGIVSNSGLDLRYPLSPELDLVGTVNPDFRNLERGVLSLDFSYFERLADETRPFFLEGRDYFGTYDAGGLFASQRITNFDAGVKTFGKLAPATDLGVLVTEDFGNQDAVVARVRHQLSPRSSWRAQYVGGGTKGNRNDGLALSYERGVGNIHYDANLTGVQDDRTGGGYRASSGVEWFRDRSYINLRYNETTRDFNPRLGFAPQTDLRGFSSYGSQEWAPSKGPFMRYGVEGFWSYRRSYDLSRPFQEEVGFWPSVILRGGMLVALNLDWSRYFGGTGDQTYGFNLRRPVGDPYRSWLVSYESGTRGGQGYRNLVVGAAYRPLPTLQLNANYQSTSYFGDDQTQTILSANYDLDQYHSVGGRFVTGPGISNYYVSFRQAGNRGAEYYLILGDPNASQFRASLILRAVFPLSFRL